MHLNQAEQILKLIRTGQYYPNVGVHKIDFEDGSQLIEDINGIGWYMSKLEGGRVLAQVYTPPATRRIPRHRTNHLRKPGQA